MLGGNENVKVIALADLFQDHLDSFRKYFENHGSEEVRSKVDIKDDHCFVGWDAYKKLLETYVEPTLDAATLDELTEFVERRKREIPEDP